VWARESSSRIGRVVLASQTSWGSGGAPKSGGKQVRARGDDNNNPK